MSNYPDDIRRYDNDPRSPFYNEPERDDDELERLKEVSRQRELIRLANNLIEGDVEAFDNFLESISEANDERILKIMTALGNWILATDAKEPDKAYQSMNYVARNVHSAFLDYWWENEEMEAAYEADAIRQAP